MAEIIHEREVGRGNVSGNGMGFLIGAILLILFAYILIVYGLPYLRGGASSGNPQINVPGKIDINLKQTK